MAMVERTYTAECTEIIRCGLGVDSTVGFRSAIGQPGLLSVCVSPEMFPDKEFLIFRYWRGMLRTSPGDVVVDHRRNIASIHTQNNSFYCFKLYHKSWVPGEGSEEFF